MKKDRIHSCNVLESGPTAKRLWHFDTDAADVRLESDQTIPSPGPLPIRLVGKDWQNIWQRKLNIAWLPADQVFLRAVQLPAADRAELLSMLEFQLEKISPIPLAQAIWSYELVGSGAENMQTVIVCVVARSVVDEFLGTLEVDNYQSDVLEVPQLNQILAGGIKEDGAWLYPGTGSEEHLWVAAWWSAGTLRHLQIARLPVGPSRERTLEEQLMQTAWAGEVEGWLNLPVNWHLVADEATAAAWSTLITGWSEKPPAIHAPLSKEEIARFSAERNARSEPLSNLLPVEFATRYRQQYIDKLWMGGLGAVLGVYLAAIAVYFVALQVYGFRAGRVEKQVLALSGSYTNVLKLKEQVQVLQEQVNLKYAALDCWKAASELLPEDFTLTWLIFGKGRTLELHGTAPPDKVDKLNDYNEAIRSVTAEGQPLFKDVSQPLSNTRLGSQSLAWSFTAELNRTDIE